jgi:hypothetical protein
MKLILFFPKKTFCAIFLKPIIISGFFILMSNKSFAFFNENKSCELELIKNSSVENPFAYSNSSNSDENCFNWPKRRKRCHPGESKRHRRKRLRRASR